MTRRRYTLSRIISSTKASVLGCYLFCWKQMPAFTRESKKNVSLLKFRTSYHFWKQKLSVQENRKIKKKINLRIEKFTTPQMSTLIAFQKKKPRNKFFNRQVLIWIIFFSVKFLFFDPLWFFSETRLRPKKQQYMVLVKKLHETHRGQSI